MRSGRLLVLGRIDYRAAWDLQLSLVAARQRGEQEDTLVLCEHPHVITLGRAKKARANVLAAGEVPVVEIERGGDATYHGPGQLVAYPILALGDDERDLHRYLRALEEGLISTLGALGIVAGRRIGATGVWVGERKVASIGIACRRWVTFHGVALNVSTDLSYFGRINPCGFPADTMTSIAALGVPVTVQAVEPHLARHLGLALGRQFAPSP